MRPCTACLTAVLSGLLVSAPAGAEMYFGSLTYSEPEPPDSDDGLFVLGSKWSDYNVTIEWEVSNEDDSYPGFPWKYTYTFSHDGSQGALSHFIVECSEGITEADIKGLTVASIDAIGLQKAGPGNPGMPEDLVGIKFDPPDGAELKSMTWSFWINRAPVWGDFHAKDGGQNAAYNYNKDASGVERGFVDPDGNDSAMDDWDPVVAPCSGSVDYHILRPDSLVPEPGTLVLLASGVMGLAAHARRRRSSARRN